MMESKVSKLELFNALHGLVEEIESRNIDGKQGDTLAWVSDGKIKFARMVLCQCQKELDKIETQEIVNKFPVE
jgi:hypothetical protein